MEVLVRQAQNNWQWTEELRKELNLGSSLIILSPESEDWKILYKKNMVAKVNIKFVFFIIKLSL